MNPHSVIAQSEISRIPGLLTAAGVEVPQDLKDALHRSSWDIQYPELPSLAEISGAKTHAEFQKLATEYARAKADRDALAAVDQTIQATRLPIAQAAFQAAKPDLIETLIARWDALAEEFSPLAQGLLGRVNMFSLDVDTAAKFVAAREVADHLRAVDAALDAVTGELKTAFANENRLCRIAEFRDYQSVKDAFYQNEKDKDGSPLAPYAAALTFGTRLRRLTPKAADAHRKALAEELPPAPAVDQLQAQAAARLRLG
ncbi:hypothetical protein AD006_12360 [Pseudonocardia sp. EC080610-09]|uniref:hypothetical protein n=1 Tax=unclassified Pseudonocardia TaxID=2619320 RepID=UPI0006CB4454|nr:MULTISPECIES: hypothetical protein [unclassified Pseudonocardia]ALE72585.1 hypothetical protein FRP1_04715 [Pseudonocardia sp. EC080625-04]ALL75899.1 hypothetical protein AD006_12360 [Pseudonocardia sp. EC080610-09]ALL82926.1 hypothetical protein AD017_20190 [Pseudonocardia sp. EC080619-01]